MLSLGICNRDGGAVCSIIYNGRELVDDYDHGRQLQIAWFVNNDLTGAINPTEAGSHEDATGPRSTSILLSARADGNSITTESHPAYWFAPGRKGKSTQPATKDILKKTLTLGYKGDPHVIVVEATVTLSTELTAPTTKHIRIEVPAFYTNRELTEPYQLDLNTGTLEKLPPAELKRTCNMNPRMGLNTNRRLIPVMSTPDGRFAVAEYTPQAKDFWTYSSYNIPCPAKLEFASNKLTTRFDHPAEPGRSYSYRTFVIIGDLETIQKSALLLR